MTPVPELPEVEVTRRIMEPVVTGRRIERADVTRARTVRRHESPEQFVDLLEGARIESVHRRAKYIVCPLSTGRSFVLHFGLSGFLQLIPVTTSGSGGTAPERPNGTRAVILLGGQAGRADSVPAVEARFVDPRVIGQLFIPPNEGPGSLVELFEKLGPEPLSETFTAELLEDRLRASSAKVKARLLDQSVVAGLGNIYTDEALFAAGIRPDRPSNKLNREDVTRLHRAIRVTLEEAIRREIVWADVRTKQAERTARRDGHPPEWPFSPLGDGGRSAGGDDGADSARSAPQTVPALSVYKRAGESCRVCGTPIERRRISGRSAHFCPTCQL